MQLKVIGVLLFSFLLFGCETATQKVNRDISTGVYATRDSINVGRFDLAKKYTNELTRLVPPPKNPIKINPFTPDPKKKSKNPPSDKIPSIPGGAFRPDPLNPFLVLPPGFDNWQVIIEGSDEYQKLLGENRDLRANEETNKKDFEKFTKETTEAIQARDAELSKQKKKSWWGWFFGLGFGFLGFGGIAGFIVVAIFFPALIPIFLNVIAALAGGINSVFVFILNIIKKIRGK